MLRIRLFELIQLFQKLHIALFFKFNQDDPSYLITRKLLSSPCHKPLKSIEAIPMEECIIKILQ